MGKYKSALIDKLDQSLSENGIDEKTHKKIMENADLVKGDSKTGGIVEWCFNAMNVMDELLDDNIRQKVREDCSCLSGGKREKMCKDFNKKFQTPEERIKAVNETHFVFGHEIEITEKGKYEVHFFDESLPEKRCSCLSGRLQSINKKWSKTWCYCCGGHVKHHLEVLLGKEVKAKLLSSALTSMGKKGCHFELKEI